MLNYSLFGMAALIAIFSAYLAYSHLKENLIDVMTGESLSNMAKKKSIVIEDIDMAKFEKVKGKLDKKNTATKIDSSNNFFR